MHETPHSQEPDTIWTPPPQTELEDRPNQISLDLVVDDPEIINELLTYPEGRNRQKFALTALRIGILALKQAEGRLDADTVRHEGDRLIAQLQQRLAEHQSTVTTQITNSINEYFDPNSGRFNERLERLLKQDGELEQVLRRQIGQEESELSRTLAKHLGEHSPLMKALNPEESEGLLKTLQLAVNETLSSERDRILREFSLDNSEGALTRLVAELTQRHGTLTENLQGSIKEVVAEFSLDNEASALSRLVRRVETAQKQISSEFSLDTEGSALARMRKEMLDVLGSHQKNTAEFQQEIRETLAAMAARKEEAQRSTTHGDEFEANLLSVMQDQCRGSGDIVTSVGNTTGLIKSCKVGDILVELGPEHAAAGAKIVIEAKESASYDVIKARDEIEIARKNRGAGIGIFVFSASTTPANIEPLVRYGNDILVVWDADQPATDLILTAALTIARALSTRATNQREQQKVDLEAIEKAIRGIEKQVGGLDEITRLGTTIKGHSEKIIDRARIMKETLTREICSLDEHMEDVKQIVSETD